MDLKDRPLKQGADKKMGGRQEERRMGKEIILQDGKISIGFRGGLTVQADALNTLRQIGIAYGMYSEYEDSPDVRVELIKEPVRELAVMVNTGNPNSSAWTKSHTLTRDARVIDRYLAFRMLYRELCAQEREEERRKNVAHPTQKNTFTLNDVFGEQHEPTLDEVFGAKSHEPAMEDVYRQQHELSEPTLYEEYNKKPEPSLADLFGEQHEPTLDEVFGGGEA